MGSGHLTPNVFKRYDITSKDDLHAAAQKLSEHMEGQPNPGRKCRESSDRGSHMVPT